MRKVWTTVDGKVMDYNDVTQQHWSNIYWYHKIFQKLKGMRPLSMEYITIIALEEIGRRFWGELLPYQPVYNYEIVWLEELGALRGNNINFNGEKIGEINIDLLQHIDLNIV